MNFDMANQILLMPKKFEDNDNRLSNRIQSFDELRTAQ